ncbi:MAG: nucleotidyltransferase substrate binding protein [Candidatus Margulisiibacteriota bacterium]
MTKDIRWIQRFYNFKKAYAQLEEGVLLSKQRQLSKLEEQGIVQAFEYTHELAWNTLKDFLEDRGVQGLYGSKDATQEAFKVGLITKGDIWMDMIQSRNQTTHTYNESTAARILKTIIDSYWAEFQTFKSHFERLENGQSL